MCNSVFMNEDYLLKRILIENRISKLEGRTGRDNRNIIKKLKRKLKYYIFA